MIKEIRVNAASGYLILLVDLALFAAAMYLIFQAKRSEDISPATMILTAVGALLTAIVVSCGFFTVQPNKAVVLQLFGKYVGTVKDEGIDSIVAPAWARSR